ncbi:hypothetical protein C0V70_05310 [Bacteriovorax stolpii]|uniref:Uncharacterized protein n=1 Tax=Bacteriovorax stolpii TaxID=960 RepID=A0A2K9NPV0_BACTC|nr:hypothetical protein [Bacteriovorax stolpii]AUN97539.1 hypothetical protein C0V70_05310 [Bacteriovorax stolpii]TDP52719.1 hypothetical protein C8D79_2485 [Bacteriovorax stolpii]
MKSRKKLLLIVLALLIITRVVITIAERNKLPAVADGPGQSNDVALDTRALHPDANLSKAPDEAVTSQHATNKDTLCQNLRSHYQNLKEIKRTEKTSVRFVNVHKKVDGIVYRMRFFYKDAAENEIPTYLLYREDQNEVEHLIETSPYKKGVKYQEIDKAQGSIIYTEEGVNLGENQDLFLHFENNELKDLQGLSPMLAEKDFIECRF